MRWAAIFSDIADGAALRADHTEAHQAYLREHKGSILLAGAMRPEPGGTPKGGLWIFEADTRADVEAIIALDPFQIHGLRATTDIYAWSTAPGYEDMVVGPKAG